MSTLPREKQLATVEILATTQWPGGKVSFRCTGVGAEHETVMAVIRELDRLASGWHLMFIWFIGVLKSRRIMQKELLESLGPREPVTIGSVYENQQTQTFRTRVKREEALGSFSDDEFGKYNAKALVLSVFSHWEDTIRPTIQNLLGVPFDTAKSDLMGELRLLRNWLTHPRVGGNAEKEYFEDAQSLVQLFGSQPGKAEVTIGNAFQLMNQLNTLSITVNPLEQEEITRFVKVTPETLEKIQSQLGPNDRLISW